MELSRINDLSEHEAREGLKRCCAASRWYEQMLAERPFSSSDELFEKAENCFEQFSTEDWLEAFAGHPKIGDMKVLAQKFASSSKWESGEQSGVAAASENTLLSLADGNNAYEKKFGYIFIVCATGKNASEMLSILQSRLPNDPEIELVIAASEQRKITRLRLEKLCQ